MKKFGFSGIRNEATLKKSADSGTILKLFENHIKIILGDNWNFTVTFQPWWDLFLFCFCFIFCNLFWLELEFFLSFFCLSHHSSMSNFQVHLNLFGAFFCLFEDLVIIFYICFSFPVCISQFYFHWLNQKYLEKSMEWKWRVKSIEKVENCFCTTRKKNLMKIIGLINSEICFLVLMSSFWG